MSDEVLMRKQEVDVLIAAAQALEQCVSDFGEKGQSVCLQVKEQAIAALAAIREVGLDIE